MRTIKADFGNWHIHCIPGDGARISVLRYSGQDLLTGEPLTFKPPVKFHGEYETRPVYGYDDCFPSVDPCIYPDEQTECRDHGELCWKEWQVQIIDNSLICNTGCLNTGISFKRLMEFAGNKLSWRFEVVNLSAKQLSFLHIMHALLPLEKIQYIKIPEFGNVTDEIISVDTGIRTSRELVKHLLGIKSGLYEMLLLKEIKDGFIKVRFNQGLKLYINFDVKLFPTIGIWWNNAGYPEEEGLKRTECAFEPIPGTCSSLSASFRDGVYLVADPGKTVKWEVNWEIEPYNT